MHLANRVDPLPQRFGHENCRARFFLQRVAHKAGRLAVGFSKAEAALLGRDQVTGLIHAREASPDGVRKLDSAVRRRAEAGPSTTITVIDVFTSAQLDLALGRSNVIHAALLAGPESETFLTRIARLDCFRAGPRSGPSPSAPDLGSAEGGIRRAQRPVKAGLRRDGKGLQRQHIKPEH